jgi:hypothetical protein
MNNLRVSITFFLGCLLVFAARAASRDDIERQADDLVTNWRSVRPDFAHDPTKAKVLEVLRKRARIAGEERARVLLLKVGDPETVARRLAEFEITPQDRGQDIALSGNPRLILGLANAIFKEENVTSEKVPGGEESVRLLPLSVRAAMAIRALILTSAVFNPSVKTWAKDLQEIGTKNIEQSRASVRAWVKMNRGVLESGRYAAAKIPELEQDPK